MPDPKLHSWAFDRSDLPDKEPRFLTFSVGVYQWLPKSDGRGVKKSKTIRVNGYVCDPERVYEQARDLVDRLNREGVHIDRPPAWLQKQYSVPKPAGLVIERMTDDLTGPQVRAIRLRVMKRVLLPQGFVQGKESAYVRRKGDQIHFIQFQASKWGHAYFVNLAFHYAFLPGFFKRKMVKPRDYHILDCALSNRIGSFLPKYVDDFEYGRNTEQLTKRLDDQASLCLRVFDDLERDWADPRAWIHGTRVATKVRGVRREWTCHRFAEFQTRLAIRFGRWKKAEGYLKSHEADYGRDSIWSELRSRVQAR